MGAWFQRARIHVFSSRFMYSNKTCGHSAMGADIVYIYHYVGERNDMQKQWTHNMGMSPIGFQTQTSRSREICNMHHNHENTKALLTAPMLSCMWGTWAGGDVECFGHLCKITKYTHAVFIRLLGALRCDENVIGDPVFLHGVFGAYGPDPPSRGDDFGNNVIRNERYVLGS